MKYPNHKARTIHSRALLTTALFLFLASRIVNAQSKQESFVPFDSFLEATRTATSGDYLQQSTNKVKDAQAFEEMRRYILNLYEGVGVSHSFLLDGDHFDCVKIEQQPSVRIQGLRSVAAPPPASELSELFQDSGEPAQAPSGSLQVAAGEMDEFGNARNCETGTIPMRRLTLEETSRFATMKNYLEKGPAGAGQAPTAEPGVSSAAAAHKYSFTFQQVNNLGQTDTLSVWKPYVNTSQGEIFSLAQSWTVGTTPVLQTAEVGWQNYPAFYGNEYSRLFIYWTADGYNKTGCYNLTCPAFVQTGKGWYLGARFKNYSTVGGTQYEFTARYYFYQGNWWLGLGSSPANATWFGYYPGKLYGTGPMASYSQLLEFGSESVGSSPWPPEGSGKWPSTGWTSAAYQRTLYYWAYPGAAATWDNLTADQPSPNCYKIAGPYWGGWTPPSNYWGVYFYFGGPGGNGC